MSVCRQADCAPEQMEPVDLSINKLTAAGHARLKEATQPAVVLNIPHFASSELTVIKTGQLNFSESADHRPAVRQRPPTTPPGSVSGR